MREVIGIEKLKDEFRYAKLKCGDLRGLGNRFQLCERLGVTPYEVAFHSMVTVGNKKQRMELTADCYGQDEQGNVYAYTMGELVEEIKNEPGKFDVHLICLVWNESRNDADRKEISRFLYSNK